MRIKPNFELRDICDQKVIIAQGIENIDFNQMIVTKAVLIFGSISWASRLLKLIWLLCSAMPMILMRQRQLRI